MSETCEKTLRELAERYARAVTYKTIHDTRIDLCRAGGGVVNLEEAKAEANRWLDHLTWTRFRARTVQRAARLAREGDRCGAKRLLDTVDSSPRVYDGSRLEEAVRVILEALEGES